MKQKNTIDCIACANMYKILFLVASSLPFSSISMAQDLWESDLLELNGFVETRLGTRIKNDPNEKTASIGEARLQLETEKDLDEVTLNLVVDLVLDPVLDMYNSDFDTGEGVIDLRQANIVMSPLSFMDIKFGRQILTWGTGDLLFINDLFAKDWNAFLIGRDIEYLKAPTDALKISVFHEFMNADIVYMPTFSADRFIDGKRISFFDQTTNTRRGRESPLATDRPDDSFTDDEYSLRLYRGLNAYEIALYYYDGFWKSPAGLDAVTGEATFPPLQVFGASLRGPMAGGIGYIEVGYYKSEHGAASDPLRRNSENRYLIGYESEIATELTMGLQYYQESMRDYNEYINSLPANVAQNDKNRRVLTLRLTRLMWQQNLKLSLVYFYSPTDEDGYARANVSYKFSDALKAEIGLNYFYGDKPYTFYSQFEENSNVYSAVRYEF